MYQDYLAERDGATVFYNDAGFITYAINGDECYFSEFYVKPEKRGSMAAYKLWSHVLKTAWESKCTHIIGSVDTTTRNWQLSERLMKKVGFSVYQRLGTMIYYRKNL